MVVVQRMVKVFPWPATMLALALLVSGCTGDASRSPDLEAGLGPAETDTAGADSGALESPAPDAGMLALRWPTDPTALDPASPAQWTVSVLDTAPHDPDAFTQGLERLADGRLIESTGRRGVSDIRIVDPATGSVERAVALDDTEFGEGLTVVDDTVIQLTWQEEIARRWRLPNLDPLPSFTYEGEGWGLCYDNSRLAMTDGSATLTWRDPETFAVLDSVTVRLAGEPVASLNELECVDGLVLANVWKSSVVLVIRPDGAVIATIDATSLVETVASNDPTRDVLNGIAAEPDGTFSMTGKLWPTRFVVRLVSE